MKVINRPKTVRGYEDEGRSEQSPLVNIYKYLNKYAIHERNNKKARNIYL